MPELGEVWSVGELAGSDTRLEALVIATGPSRIHLVTRTGRRITAPVASWERVWHLIAPTPATKQNCERERCTQEAFFRYYPTSDATVWLCEDHLPHGVAAQFASDPDRPPQVEITCIFCGGPVLHTDVLHLLERSTVVHRCNQCRAQWCPLISRGLGDDGTLLAQALHELKALSRHPEKARTFVEIRIGYRSYRDLCRSLGVGSTQHIDGIPVIQDSRLEDQLTLAVEFRGVETWKDTVDALMYAMTTTEAVAPGVDLDFPDIKVTVDSFWRRHLRNTAEVVKVLALVDTAAGRTVHYEYVQSISTDLDDLGVKPLEHFLQYWAPTTPHKSTWPPEGTLWRHRDDHRVVQVNRPTMTHIANVQVSYRTLQGVFETTATDTFRRLYHELPLPPEHHIWVTDGKAFRVHREAGRIRALGYDSPAARECTLNELLETHDPLTFHPAYTNFDGEDDPALALASGATWQGTDGAVLITDVGLTHRGERFVRYQDHSSECIRAEGEFRERFHYVTPAMPCMPGDTWVHRSNDALQITITKANALSGKVTFEERESPHIVQVINYSDLVRYYRRLYIRTYWEILDEDGDDQTNP